VATRMVAGPSVPANKEFVDDIPEGSSILANVAAVVCFPITMLTCCVCLDPKEEMVCMETTFDGVLGRLLYLVLLFSNQAIANSSHLACLILCFHTNQVITNCGTYTGTITEPGVHVTNPWGRETRKITTAQITADIPNIKVRSLMRLRPMSAHCLEYILVHAPPGRRCWTPTATRSSCLPF
jgi:hypothetical protein